MHFSGIELENKYDHSKTYCNTIDDYIIESKRKLIPYAMEGSYSDSINVGNDMGAMAYICYSYNSTSDMYTPIILEMKGDWESRNESDAAISLVNWLKNCCQEE